MKETTLNENIVIDISDIHNKYDLLEIKKKLNKTDLISALRLFRRYNLIEITGDLNTLSSKVVILPTILLALKSEDITEVYNTLRKLAQDEKENGGD